MQLVKVNKLRDFVDRVGWTFAEAFAGLVSIDWLANGVNLALVHQVEAAALAAAVATAKVLIAQQFGTHNLGDAVPGGVLEVKRQV